MNRSGGPLARLLAPFRGRQDSEHEQALIRIVRDDDQFKLRM